MFLQLFQKYSQSYVNLNAKKYSKIQLLLKSRRVVLVFSIWMQLIELLELFRMALVKFVTFVVLKILDNLVSMQNSLNANNC